METPAHEERQQLDMRRAKWSVEGLTEGLNEEVDSAVGDGVVGPLPVEHVLEVASGLEGLDNHLDFEVGNAWDVLVGRQVAVLLDNDDTLSQQVRVNSSLFFSAHEHHASAIYDIQ